VRHQRRHAAAEIATITKRAFGAVKKAKLGIHTHDDCGLGVANALAGIEAGALQVQGTINGYGERTGNCNLVTTIANLQLKMNRRVLPDDKLAELRDLSLFVDEVANQRPSGRAPFVGSAAFAHKGGIHVNAVNKLAASYEHIRPNSSATSQRVLVGELAGRANIMLKARTLGLKLEEKSPEALKVLDRSSISKTRATNSRPPTPRSSCSSARRSASTSPSSSWSSTTSPSARTARTASTPARPRSSSPSTARKSTPWPRATAP
jgi:isopropylmalate/homocitrate/citramalate synthase